MVITNETHCLKLTNLLPIKQLFQSNKFTSSDNYELVMWNVCGVVEPKNPYLSNLHCSPTRQTTSNSSKEKVCIVLAFCRRCNFSCKVERINNIESYKEKKAYGLQIWILMMNINLNCGEIWRTYSKINLSFMYLGFIICKNVEIEGNDNHCIQVGFDEKWKSVSSLICKRNNIIRAQRNILYYFKTCWAEVKETLKKITCWARQQTYWSVEKPRR